MMNIVTPFNARQRDVIIASWLIVIMVMVFVMIVLGGVTRLTHSGLSMVEWHPITGWLPPIGDTAWLEIFNKYKMFPEFQKINKNMDLSGFKSIFWLEYLHRLWGRLIGLAFLIPFIVFCAYGWVSRELAPKLILMFFLGGLQAVLGWYMVKSGLVNDVTVSHYRLSLHLTIAIIIISIIFWLLLNLKNKTNLKFFLVSKSNFPFLLLILLIYFQIILGAFVSGLDAGKIYQTWPLMGHTYLPNDLIFTDLKNLIDFENHSLIQFYHRNLAYLISFYIIILSILIFIKNLKNLFKPLKILIFFFTLQVFLGIFTLVSGLNIYLALLHQINSLLLVFSTINLYYFSIK